MTHALTLVAIFIVSALVGYFVIRKVPGLLHTPLMSGMNALSGITVVGAMIAFVEVLTKMTPSPLQTTLAILSGIAIILAMINVIGGIDVTLKMLRMFNKSKEKGGES